MTTKKPDFRPFVPPPTHPKIAAMRGRDAYHQHADAALANPAARALYSTLGGKGTRN